MVAGEDIVAQAVGKAVVGPAVEAADTVAEHQDQSMPELVEPVVVVADNIVAAVAVLAQTEAVGTGLAEQAEECRRQYTLELELGVGLGLHRHRLERELGAVVVVLTVAGRLVPIG